MSDTSLRHYKQMEACSYRKVPGAAQHAPDRGRGPAGSLGWRQWGDPLGETRGWGVSRGLLLLPWQQHGKQHSTHPTQAVIHATSRFLENREACHRESPQCSVPSTALPKPILKAGPSPGPEATGAEVGERPSMSSSQTGKQSGCSNKGVQSRRKMGKSL